MNTDSMVKRKITLIFMMISLAVMMAGCGRIKTAKELYREAVRTYGKCEIVSQTEDEDGTVVVLRDELQGFEYSMYSGMHSIVIDGSSFGSVENTSSSFDSALNDYVMSECLGDLEEVCASSSAGCYVSDFDFLVIRAENADDARTAALACAEMVQAYNLQGRLDGRAIVCYEAADDGNEYYHHDRFGSVVLPDIEWISTEQETINYYTEMAQMQTDKNAQYIRQRAGTFADTGADLDRVVYVLGTDYPTEDTSPVMFYYFRASDGTEYYLCDFNYYEEDYYKYAWYTNYYDVVPGAEKEKK